MLTEQVFGEGPPTSVPEAKDRLSRVASELGFDYFSYVGGRSFNPRRGGHDIWTVRPTIVTQLPPGWAETYHKEDFGKVDPILSMTLEARLPFAWNTENLDKETTPQQWQFLSAAHDFGVTRGYTVPVYGPVGDFAMFSYISNQSEREFAALVANYGHHLHLMSLHYHQVISKLEEGDRSDYHLTVRETEVLDWAAAGKTTPETATIMHISRKTVEFHLYNLMKKLDVYSKPQAVAKGICLGLIHPQHATRNS